MRGAAEQPFAGAGQQDLAVGGKGQPVHEKEVVPDRFRQLFPGQASIGALEDAGPAEGVQVVVPFAGPCIERVGIARIEDQAGDIQVGRHQS